MPKQRAACLPRRWPETLYKRQLGISLRPIYLRRPDGPRLLHPVIGGAMTARADIIHTVGSVPQTDENVLLNNGLTGNPIFGTTNQTGLSVRSQQSGSCVPSFRRGAVRERLSVTG